MTCKVYSMLMYNQCASATQVCQYIDVVQYWFSSNHPLMRFGSGSFCMWSKRVY